MEQAAAGGKRRAGSGRFWLGPVAGVAALAILAGAYALLVRPKHQTKPTHYLVGISASSIRSLTFQAHHKQLTLYQQAAAKSAAAGTTWTIGHPGGTSADQTLVQGFVSSLVTLQASRTLAAKPTASQLQGWALAPAHASVRITPASGKPVLLAVGLSTPVGGYYARVDNAGPVYIIHGMVPAEISADPKAWLPPPSSFTSSSASSSSSSSSTAPPAGGATSTASSTAPAASGATPSTHSTTTKGTARSSTSTAKATTTTKKAG